MSLVMRHTGDVTWRGFIVGYYESSGKSPKIWDFRGYTDEAPECASGSPEDLRVALSRHFLSHEKIIGRQIVPKETSGNGARNAEIIKKVEAGMRSTAERLRRQSARIKELETELASAKARIAELET